MASRGHLLFAFLSGFLLALGLSLIAMFVLFWLFLRHEFIIGTTLFSGLAVFFSPTVLVIAGGALGVRALQGGKPLQGKRAQLGLLLLLLPLILFSLIPAGGVLFGSLGLDVHWNASRVSGYGALTIFGAALIASCLLGWRLLQSRAE